METATYIGVLSVSLEADPTAPLLCVGEGLGVQFKSAVIVIILVCVTIAVTMTNSVAVVIYSVMTVVSSSRPESVPLAVPLVTLMLWSTTVKIIENCLL